MKLAVFEQQATTNTHRRTSQAASRREEFVSVEKPIDSTRVAAHSYFLIARQTSVRVLCFLLLEGGKRSVRQIQRLSLSSWHRRKLSIREGD